MNIEQKKLALVQLLQKILILSKEEKEELYQTAKSENAWFTPDNLDLTLAGICEYLKEENLEKWLENYPQITSARNPKKVGIVMAGNIPAVGFHDLLCVLISGHKVYAKLSSQDTILLKFIHQKLKEVSEELASNIFFLDKLNEAEAFIATGSNNSARYFEYYFSKKPHIIRKNRNACAVLKGYESQEDLKAISSDIFQYFGLGCRSVSKLYVPQNYDFSIFFKAIENWKSIIHHYKYTNNYDYQKSILLVNRVEHKDNGFILLKEAEALASPVAVLHYEFYENEQSLQEKLSLENDKIQCIVSSKGNFPNSIPFGTAQKTQLWDYADGVDTLAFLLA